MAHSTTAAQYRDSTQRDHGGSPPKWKMMISEYFGLLPALLIVNYAIKWLQWEPALWLKLIVSAAIIVPLMKYAITPLVKNVLDDWLYEGVAGGPPD